MLFYLTAKEVYDIVMTNSQYNYKAFTKEDLTHGGLLIQGSLQNSFGGTSNIETGACHYNSYLGKWELTHPCTMVNGTTYTFFSPDDFEAKEDYCGYIKNKGSGYVYGTVYFYETNELT